MPSHLRLLLRVTFALLRPFPRASGRLAFGLFSRPFASRPLSRRAETALDWAEKVEIEHDDLRVLGYRWSPSGACAETPTVIMAHGWSSRAARFVRWIEPLNAAGFRVVAFDGPAHGMSEGRRLTMPDYVRLLVSIAHWVEAPYAIVGHSFGGAGAVFAAVGSEMSGLPEVSIERLVLVAAPDAAVDIFDQFGAFVGLSERQLESMKRAAERASSVDVRLERWSVREILAGRPMPTLVVHDRDDDEIPYANGMAIAGLPGVELLPTDGLGHHRVVGDAQVIARAVAFLLAGVREKQRIA